MFYATLICTDESCALEFETWGELRHFDGPVCDACGCAMQAIAFSEATVSDPRRPILDVELRDAS